MTSVLEGKKFWKTGDHGHVWVVDAVLPKKDGQGHYAILVSEDGITCEDVDLSHLENPENYTAVPMTEAEKG